MKFKTIELHNFGRFKGTHLFQIDTTDSKNIILVKGYNDRGKTTLFDAINFAMYGSLKGRNSRKAIEEYVNFQAADEGDGHMSVEIKFEHEGDDYKIERVQKFLKTRIGEQIFLPGPDVVTIWEGSSPKRLVSREQNQQWINHILPADASQFFFFDGEEIKRYVDKQSGDKIKSSIEMVLGIRELLNARDDLASIQQDFAKDHMKQLKAKAKDLEGLKEMETIEEEKEAVEEEIQSLEVNILSANELVKDCDKQLSRYDSIQDKVNQRRKASEDLDETKKKLEKASNEEREVRSYASLLLLYPLLKDIWNKRDETPATKTWESEFAQRLLKEDLRNCICGSELDEEKIEILKSKIEIKGPSRFSLIKNSADQLLVRYQPEDKKNKFVQIIQEISGLKQQESQWADTVKKLTDDIDNVDKVDDIIQGLNNKRNEAFKSIGINQTKLEQLQIKKEELTKKLKTINSKIENNINDEELDRVEKIEKFSDKIREAVEVAIERITEERISTIEDYSSDIFRRLTNNPQLYTGLKIDDSYEIKVKRYDDTILPTYRYSPSAGASQIVATSLIAGLSKYTTREAPIIIDTPLGRLDPIHREKLIRLYSSLSSQVIILYQPSELDRDDIMLFGDSVASEWVIDKDYYSPDLSTIVREFNHL